MAGSWLLVLLALRYLLPTGKGFLLVLVHCRGGDAGAQGPKLIPEWPRVSNALGLPFRLGLLFHVAKHVTERDHLPPLTLLFFTQYYISLLFI